MYSLTMETVSMRGVATMRPNGSPAQDHLYTIYIPITKHKPLTMYSLTMETVSMRGVATIRPNGSASSRASARMRSVPAANRNGVSQVAAFVCACGVPAWV